MIYLLSIHQVVGGARELSKFNSSVVHIFSGSKNYRGAPACGPFRISEPLHHDFIRLEVEAIAALNGRFSMALVPMFGAPVNLGKTFIRHLMVFRSVQSQTTMISGGMAPCHSCGTGFSSSLLPNAAQIVQLRDILRSNTVPLNLSTFGGTISAAPAELDRYDAEITRLEYHLKRLASERQSLVAYTDGCRSIFSPVRRLPAEILAEIFDMCSPTEIYHVSRHTTPQQEVERLSGRHLLQLAQVCSVSPPFASS
jgi:hypothetical protein